MSDRIYTCTNMASAGLHTETQKTTLRHNAYFPSKNASTHATPQGTLRSLIGVTARHAYIFTLAVYKTFVRQIWQVHKVVLR